MADFNSEDETEQLRASVDFLVELSDTVSPVRLLHLLFLCAFFQSLTYSL